MGFSLGRALAGALAGGAAAAGQLADAQILEATRQREADANFQRQRELMVAQDELQAARADRVAQTKQRYEEGKIEKVADFMKSGLSTLKEEDVNPGSVAGQQRLAVLATENGHPELGDKFFDNATKLGQIESTAELRKEEMKTRLATISLARESANDNKKIAREARDEQFNQNKISNMSSIEFSDRDGGKQKINAYGQFNSLFQEAKDAGHSNSEALEAVSAASSLTGRAIRSGVNPDQALDAAISKAATWRKPPAPTPAPAPAATQGPVQTVPPSKSAAPTKRTPGFFESMNLPAPVDPNNLYGADRPSSHW